MKFGLSDTSYNLLKNELSARSEIEKTLLFGSRALGTFEPGSDIDLAIFGDKITPGFLLDLGVKFNEKMPLPYKVDLVHFESLENEDLKAHILRVGIEF